jgi:hypothetical protein
MKYGTFIESQGGFTQELRFLAKAVSGDETRYFMNHIFIEPSEATLYDNKKNVPLFRGVATDGRRLHIVDPISESAGEVFGLVPGFWHVVSNKQSCVQLAHIPDFEGQFPNYRQVIPTSEVLHHSKFSGFTLSGRNVTGGSREIAKLFKGFPELTIANLSYLMDLGMDTTWKVEWRGSKPALVFKSGAKTAIIGTILADD